MNVVELETVFVFSFGGFVDIRVIFLDLVSCYCFFDFSDQQFTWLAKRSGQWVGVWVLVQVGLGFFFVFIFGSSTGGCVEVQRRFSLYTVFGCFFIGLGIYFFRVGGLLVFCFSRSQFVFAGFLFDCVLGVRGFVFQVLNSYSRRSLMEGGGVVCGTF